MKAETLPLRPLSNGTTEAIDDSKRWKRRHLVAVLAMFGFAFIYGTQITLSNTFMEDEQKVNKTKIPDSHEDAAPVPSLTPHVSEFNVRR
ncbi:MFS transporter [Caenorhabditis elegans]|uniref:MFS transporter n=1 Tax=Caenorhabditis elegans TaxID=6239 RepID=Q8MPR4_CAEEL|nr:MFS transporter [Caenorhabditis elegans]CCD66909.1 MFS transporter [Caenorhabditis elegans]|eukprot:NP_741954.3 Uncharacterized protein CELE_ZK54.3 [Caenorhabditis elegans]